MQEYLVPSGVLWLGWDQMCGLQRGSAFPHPLYALDTITPAAQNPTQLLRLLEAPHSFPTPMAPSGPSLAKYPQMYQLTVPGAGNLCSVRIP